MYDGVRTHGFIHQMRMENVFWGRLGILLTALDVVLAALPAPSSQERAEMLMRMRSELYDAVYVGRRESREARDEKMKKVLKSQAEKNIEIMPLED